MLRAGNCPSFRRQRPSDVGRVRSEPALFDSSPRPVAEGATPSTEPKRMIASTSIAMAPKRKSRSRTKTINIRRTRRTGKTIKSRMPAVMRAFIPWVSVPMAAVLLVATFTVHLPYGFPSIKLQSVTAAGAQFGQPGYETDLLYLACLAALVLAGSGRFAVDGLRAKFRRDSTA
jgi:hypothetical protein